MIWYTGQWKRYSPYERVPIHASTGAPSTAPVNVPRCVTAAITSTVANATTRNPPRNSHGSAPSGVTRCSFHASRTRTTPPVPPTTSSHGPLLRSGPRITAAGRHSIANAAPINRPVARVIVDR